MDSVMGSVKSRSLPTSLWENDELDAVIISMLGYRPTGDLRLLHRKRVTELLRAELTCTVQRASDIEIVKYKLNRHEVSVYQSSGESS